MSTPTLYPGFAHVLDNVEGELRKATRAFGSFVSPHEGYAVILEEIDELWDEIKGDKLAGARGRQRKEATQVAAMGCRFLVDVPALGGTPTIDEAMEQLDRHLRNLVDHARPFRSPHEAYAHLSVARRDFDGAIDDFTIIADSVNRETTRDKARAIGVLAARFLLDIPEEN